MRTALSRTMDTPTAELRKRRSRARGIVMGTLLCGALVTGGVYLWWPTIEASYDFRRGRHALENHSKRQQGQLLGGRTCRRP